MKLQLIRKEYTDKSTIGELFLDDEFFCYTLEDVIRTFKIPDKTAIPAGTYKVDITLSNKFQILMPILLDVPNYTGVRIHFGNHAKDTSGCILVGIDKGKDVIYNSRRTFDELMEILTKEKNIEIRIDDTLGPYTSDFKNKEE